MSKLLDKAINAEPVLVGYNFKGSMIDEWVYNLLVNKFKIDGVATVKTNIVKGGSRPDVAIYVFLDTNSRNIRSNTSRIPDHIRKKMEEGVYNADDQLRKALIPLCDKFKLGTSRGYVFCRLNIFKVLGVMLAVNHREHGINITEINRLKKDCLLTVFKYTKFVDENNAADDKFANIIQQMER